MDPPVAIIRFALARSAMFLFFFSISRPRTSVAGFAIERTRARDDGARRGGTGEGDDARRCVFGAPRSAPRRDADARMS